MHQPETMAELVYSLEDARDTMKYPVLATMYKREITELPQSTRTVFRTALAQLATFNMQELRPGEEYIAGAQTDIYHIGHDDNNTFGGLTAILYNISGRTR